MDFIYKMVDNMYNEYTEKPINSFCSTILICYMSLVIVYKVFKKIYDSCIYKKMSLYPDVPVSEPEVVLSSIAPLTREELEKQRLEILKKKEELREEKIKELVNARNKEIELLTLQVLKKISSAKVRGESRIVLPKEELHRDVKVELRKQYDVEKMPKEGCLACTKKVMYYIDFGIEEAGTILEKLANK